MSHDVQFDDVRRRIRDFGDRATLVTVTPAATPHLVSAVVDVRSDRLIVAVGSRTRANLLEHSNLTLMWNPPGDNEYQLILDGVADELGEPDDRGVSSVSISVTSGILHRLAGLTASGPSCIAIGGDSSD